ncbi:YcjX family protein [Roseinatronobacter alkalisoli]|uniref:YcjX family protein n=1 Tax=Roseinatronobacter alkalisoli TaxID=3028235 RepID=A0ABT5TBS4_9RHOB|nr:YcjX family protein [Roseinatronobacter sp. HJB301]MDD7972578.1 YcjX family protein [Roseinatronobacter sp. HJB301]
MASRRLTYGLINSVESAGASVTGALSGVFSEPALRLGVTGLSGAGKTVFITSLVANLLDRGRMGRMQAVAGGHVEAAFLQPQPDDTLPRFDYEKHLAALTGPAPFWPEGTRHISQLRLSFRVRPAGILAGIRGSRIQHIDIIDYPGEWLLDLVLLDKSHAQWSTETLARMQNRPYAAEFLTRLAATGPTAPHDEATALALTDSFTTYLHAARANGLPDITPGRLLLPGELAGSPVLTFIPMAGTGGRGSLGREMARRFDAYKAQVVRPFFRNHFARIDRQVVLADVLGAIHAGPEAVDRLGQTLSELLSAFRPGRNAFLLRLLGSKRVERILFAATKADHLHHSQHPRLSAITTALLRQSRDRAEFAGARTKALSIAALRTTVEEQHDRNGQMLDCVRGKLLDSGKQAAFHAGDLPADPMQIIGQSGHDTQRWLNGDYRIMQFAPAALTRAPGDGLPHIRMDSAAEFLIGDLLT